MPCRGLLSAPFRGLYLGGFRVLTFLIEGPYVGPWQMIGMAGRHPLGRALSSTKQCWGPRGPS